MKTFHYLRKLFVLCCLSFPVIVHAQALQYSYDAAGNRISKTLIVVANQSSKKPKFDETSISLQNTIKTSARTTQGIIDVKIEEFDSNKSYKISVYTLNGIDVTSVIPISGTTTIDISNQQRGVYILSVTIDGDTQTFKISKK